MELGTKFSGKYRVETDRHWHVMGSKLYEREFIRQHKESKTM
jgi:hypothetical protein